jgi:hypothetical protein
MIVIPYDMTLTGATMVLSTQGNFTGDNENRIALFTSDGTNLTCVAVTANNEAYLETAINTRIDVAFTATYAATAGVYWIATLYNQSAVTTAPQQRCLANTGNAAIQSIFLPTSQRAVWTINRTAIAVGNTIAWSGTASSSAVPWMGVY